MKRLAYILLLLLAGCGSPGKLPTSTPPPLKPFVGTIYGKLTIYLEGGHAIRDSFVLRCPNTTTARFSFLRNGVQTARATVRDSVLPPWNEDGDSLVAEPGLAWRATVGNTTPPSILHMWGYYDGGYPEAQFVGRLRYTMPGPNPEVAVVYRGSWGAHTTRNP